MLPPGNEVWEGNVHREGGGRRSLYDTTSCLAVWYHVPLGGVSVSGPMFLLGGLHRGGGGVLLGRLPPKQRPPYGKERAVRILLECILVYTL